MPHIDEGQLHAYLDGEIDALGGSVAGMERHLAECAACRSRLEAARRIHGDAEAILAGAAPPAMEAPPPFAEVRERARSRGTAGVGRARSIARYRGLRNLAWAASLVLALGLGWLARDMLRVGAPPASESPESLERFREAPAERDAPAVDRLDADAGPTSARDEARVRAATADPAAGAGTDQPVPTAQSREDPGPDAPEGGPRLESMVVTGVEETEARRADGEEAARAAMAERPDGGAPRRAGEPAPSAAPANVLDQSIAGSGWRPIDTEEAARILGGPLWRVENRVVIGIAARADGAGPLVRTTQRVDDYRLLELFQRPAAAPPAGDRAPADLGGPGPDAAMTDDRGADVTEVTIVRDGQVITARSGLPANAMEILLRRLRPDR